jgi:valyl-tRNA synthetase
LFDEALCAQGQHFANKIWNGFRLVQSWEVADIPQPETAQLGIEWYRGAFNQALAVIEDHFEKYRISDALMALYKLIWDDYSAWLLEIIKPAYGAPIDKTTYEAVLGLLEQNLVLLHPFMPFLTEEIWQYIQPRSKEQALIVGQWPKPYTTQTVLTNTFGLAAEVIAGVRNIRQEHGIPQKELLSLGVLADDQFPKAWVPVITKLAHVEAVTWVEVAPEGSASFRVMSSECFVPLLGQIDPVEELKKLNEELVYTQGFLVSVEKKLSNERFVQNAPEPVLALERKKQADALEKIEMLSQRIAQLS